MKTVYQQIRDTEIVFENCRREVELLKNSIAQ